MNKLSDIRLIDKAVKADIIKKYNKEFVYALNSKLNMKIYKIKNKYYVDYFNLISDENEIKLIDIEKLIDIDLNKKECFEINEIENINYEKFIEITSLLNNVLYPAKRSVINNLTYELYLNDIYSTDLPFQRDILIVKNNNNEIIAKSFITGIFFNEKDIVNCEEENLLENLILGNADLKQLFKKDIHLNKKELIVNYIKNYNDLKFIDSVYVVNKHRGNGIGEEIYKFLFSFYNKNKIVLTSGDKEIQTEDAKKLWNKLKKKYSNEVIDYGNHFVLRLEA